MEIVEFRSLNRPEANAMIAVGLMSGTSADGVSAATIRVEKRLELLAYRTFPYPRALRERVLLARDLRASGLSELHADLGKFYSRKWQGRSSAAAEST